MTSFEKLKLTSFEKLKLNKMLFGFVDTKKPNTERICLIKVVRMVTVENMNNEISMIKWEKALGIFEID